MAGICKKADAKHMNHIIIKQSEQIDARTMGQVDNRFAVKPVVDGEDVALCGVNIVEVEPGCKAYGYHYHEANEEVFCIGTLLRWVTKNAHHMGYTRGYPLVA